MTRIVKPCVCGHPMELLQSEIKATASDGQVVIRRPVWFCPTCKRVELAEVKETAGAK